MSPEDLVSPIGRPVSDAELTLLEKQLSFRAAEVEDLVSPMGRSVSDEILALLEETWSLRDAGGPGSGNFGHVGRPGEVGGSGESDISDRYPIINEMRAYDEKDAKSIRSKLRQKGRLNEDGTVSLYHVTVSEPDSILKQGLIPAFESAPGQDWQAEHSQYATYFFLDKGVAIDQSDQTNGTVVEARIPITGSTLSRFLPDEDSSTNIYDGVKTLVEGGAVAFIGGVPPSALKIVHGVGRALRAAGGAGSGNFGHVGRPGEVGGSGEGGDQWTTGSPTDADKELIGGDWAWPQSNPSGRDFDKLRDPNTSEGRQMTHALGNMPIHDGVTYRGIALDHQEDVDKLLASKEYEMRLHSSASTDLDQAMLFADAQSIGGQTHAVVLEMHGRGRDINAYLPEDLQSTKEVVMVAGTRYKVESFDKYAYDENYSLGYTHIVLKELR